MGPAAASRITALAVIGVAALSLALAACGGVAARVPAGAVRINLAVRPHARPLPSGFVGLSIEYPSVPAYAGPAADPNPLFVRLVRSLDPGQQPVIRVGGDTTDWTWWPVPGMVRPPGIRYALTRGWLASAAAAARALDARLILGVNLEADSPRLAGTEARVMLRGIGTAHLAGFELGNEPEAYSTLGWYYLHHKIPVLGRPAGYGFGAYLRDYARISRSLPSAVPLVGPASGAPPWLAGLGRFLARFPRVREATFHRYPLHRCATARASIAFPTIGHLLTPVSASGPATSLAGAVRAAHRAGASFRADELNSVSCGGAHGVSDTFAAALWVMDTLFNLDRVGVDGVNLHTFRSGTYAPFFFSHRGGRWTARVPPLYYGLLMFARAAPPGSRLLASPQPASDRLHVWATRSAGRVRVLLINDGLDRPITVALRLPGRPGQGRVQRLTAPAPGARSGVRLGGQGYARASTTGELGGTPHNVAATVRQGRYVISLPPASAALLTVADG